MSTISAGNTINTAFKVTADTTGNLTLSANATGKVILTNPLQFADGTSANTAVTATTNASVLTSGTLAVLRLPAGTVLQTVNATYSTGTSTTSSSFQDTGLSASITPLYSTSKILVLVSHPQNFVNALSDAQLGMALNLCRNGSQLTAWTNYLGYTNSSAGNQFPTASLIYWDSPSTTSTTTYKTQFRVSNGGAYTVSVQNSSTPSSITLLEIAQ